MAVAFRLRSRPAISEWTVDQVCDFLEMLQLDPAVIDTFRAEAVDGRVLCEVSDEDLSGPPFQLSFGLRKALLKELAQQRKLDNHRRVGERSAGAGPVLVKGQPVEGPKLSHDALERIRKWRLEVSTGRLVPREPPLTDEELDCWQYQASWLVCPITGKAWARSDVVSTMGVALYHAPRFCSEREKQRLFLEEARIRQLNEELHEYCTLSFDEVDPFQQQGLTCRMLAFLKSLSRVLSWQDGDERGETPAYEMLDLSEVDLQMFKVVAQKADELIERHRFRQAYELLCRMRPCLSHQGEEVTREVTHSSSIEEVPSTPSETPVQPPQMEVASQVSPVSPAPQKAKNCNGNSGAKAKNNGGRHEKSAAGTGGGKYLCRVKVGIEEDVAFQVCRRIIGPGGENMKRIIETVGNGAVKIRLRGRGSKYLEGPEHKESNDDLMLCVSATNRRSFEKASGLVEALIGAVQQDYVAFCQARRWPVPTLTVKREAQRSR